MSESSRIFDRTSQLISLPSISCSRPSLDMSNMSVINQLAEWLEPLGFKCEVMPLPTQPNKANLIATLGSGPGGLVLAGHTDTVPYDDNAWQSDPFKLTERDGSWYGLGTSDMKAFLVLAIEAAAAFKDQQLKSPLIILATADEETGMEGARALVEAGQPQARYAVIGEPTGMQPIRSHKGIFMERIRILGEAGHSSLPDNGCNAIDGMYQVLTSLYQFRNQLKQTAGDPAFKVQHSTLNTGCIHGGDNPNRIPGSCELDIDLRFVPGLDLKQLREDLQQIVTTSLEGSPYRVEFESLFDGIPAFATDTESDIVLACEKLTGHRAGAVDFATEGSLFNTLGMQTVVLGPGHIECAHRPDEHLDSARVTPTIDLLKSLITKFCL